jgi:hypothetical protein
LTSAVLTVIATPLDGFDVFTVSVYTAVTVTEAVFDPLPQLAEPAESGVYVTVSVSLPAESELAGTLIVAPPLLRVVEEDV